MFYLKPKSVTLTSLSLAFTPYILLIVVLIIGKFIFMNFSYTLTLAPGISHNLNLFNPGFAFLTVILILNLKHSSSLRPLVMNAAYSLRKPFLGIFFTSALSYLMIFSGMLETLSSLFVSDFLPFFSVFLGAFGSFLAGSATVSNLLFGEIQSLAANKIGVSNSLVLALQLVGAGIGNMIALSNILAVEAAVGMAGEEAGILKRLFLPCILYLVIVGLIGMAFSSLT